MRRYAASLENGWFLRIGKVLNLCFVNAIATRSWAQLSLVALSREFQTHRLALALDNLKEEEQNV